MGFHLSDRVVSKLDEDQRHTLWVDYNGQPEKRLMISESGAYGLLVYHYAPGNRLLREWLTHQVVPAVRDAGQSMNADRPMLSLLHWQDEGWIRLRDMPFLLFTAREGVCQRLSLGGEGFWRRFILPSLRWVSVCRIDQKKHRCFL